MTDDTTDGRPEPQIPREASRREREELRIAGAMANRYQNLPHLAKDWMADLWRVGYYLGGRKEAGEVTFPPEQLGGKDGLRIRLDNGQTLLLVLAAYLDDPRRDGRTFPRAEVRGVAPRSDRAQLAALCVLEGTELPKKQKPRDERLDSLRKHLRGEPDRAYTGEWREVAELSPEEDKMVDFVRLLLWSYRPDLSEASDEGIDMFVEIYDRVAGVAEAVRQLSDYLEFGVPGSDTRPVIKDAQLDIYAAELKHISGMNNREIAEKLRLDLNRGKARSSKQVAAARAERGTQLYIRAMGGEKWERYKALLRQRYRISN